MPIPDAQTKAAKSTPAAETAAKGEKPPVPVVAVPAAKVSYSVQVGAFRQLSEAEAKVSAVKAKGFDCAIEPPTAGNQLYLVKVGNYAARADALSMQRKLTKAGLSCFIKTN
jgi:cell division protein FtsN